MAPHFLNRKNHYFRGGKSMNKAELVEKIAKQTSMTKSHIETVLDSVVDTITKSVKKGEEVKLVGFGTFSKAKRKARTGRNPNTGKEIHIPATWTPKFKPGSDFKNIVK
jgi:DNA-binding protein HU-beta